MRIGIDLDGTVYQWDRTARYLLRTHRGYTENGPLGRESTDWDYIASNVSEEDWAWLWNEAVTLGLFRHGHLYAGAIEAMREMAEFAEIVIITKRPTSAVLDTLDFLSYSRLPISELHILPRHLQRKSDVSPACDLYIDDAPQVIGDLAKNTASKIGVMDRPWNRAIRYVSDNPYDRIVRVPDWPAAANLARLVKEEL